MSQGSDVEEKSPQILRKLAKEEAKPSVEDFSVAQIKVFSLQFNSKGTKVLLGHSKGFTVLDSDSLEVQVKREFGKGVGKMAMIESSNILVFTGAGIDPHCKASEVVLWDEEQALEVARLEFTCRVTGIQMTKYQ